MFKFEYFCIRYSEIYIELLFVSDLIAIPGLKPGGMENWGLITFEEKFVLISNESSVSEKFTAADLIAHEIAHMVINLVLVLFSL